MSGCRRPRQLLLFEPPCHAVDATSRLDSQGLGVPDSRNTCTIRSSLVLHVRSLPSYAASCMFACLRSVATPTEVAPRLPYPLCRPVKANVLLWIYSKHLPRDGTAWRAYLSLDPTHNKSATIHPWLQRPLGSDKHISQRDRERMKRVQLIVSFAAHTSHYTARHSSFPLSRPFSPNLNSCAAGDPRSGNSLHGRAWPCIVCCGSCIWIPCPFIDSTPSPLTRISSWASAFTYLLSIGYYLVRIWLLHSVVARLAQETKHN